jgi:hypothetical protein
MLTHELLQGANAGQNSSTPFIAIFDSIKTMSRCSSPPPRVSSMPKTPMAPKKMSGDVLAPTVTVITITGVVLIDAMTTFETVSEVFVYLRGRVGWDHNLRLVNEDIVLTSCSSCSMLSPTWTLVKSSWDE